MITLSQQTLALLDDIERRIDPESEESMAAQWHDFLYDRFDGDIFQPYREKISSSALSIPHVNINDAIADYDQMLLAQLQLVSGALNSRNQNLCVRANYGTGILSSLFGAEIFVMPREMDTLPTTRSIGDTERIRELVERGMPDLMGGFGRRVFEFGELCAEVFRKYPNIHRYVEVYHPDTQGPLDICELLWGCEMFYAMYEEPELVHSMMQLLTDTYTAFLNKWFEIFPVGSEMNVHWSALRHRGRILLRDDSAMNLSPELYEEFAAPYDGALLDRFDGGAVHFCGRGDHYIETLCNTPKLYGINMSQPELNNMEKIWANTVDKGIKMLMFPHTWAKKDVVRPNGYHHQLSI